MKPIMQIRAQSTNILILIISTLTLALGVALMANYITSLVGPTFCLFLIASVFVVISLFFISKIINPKIHKVIRIDAGFFFNPTNLESKEIIGYEFNKDMGEYLKAFGVENKAYAVALHKGYKDYKYVTGNYNPTKLDFYNLSSSAAEFLFLKQLSYHLNSYFVDEEIDNSKIEVIPREKMSQAVLMNRVLDLISKNHTEREAFCENEDCSEGVLVYSKGENGEIFQQMQLELPQGSSINRNNNNSLEIDNKVFKMTFTPFCDHCSTVVAHELINGNYDAPINLRMNLEIIVKKRILFDQSDLEIYEWLDSFIAKFEKYSSIKKLHERSNIDLLRLLKSSLIPNVLVGNVD